MTALAQCLSYLHFILPTLGTSDLVLVPCSARPPDLTAHPACCYLTMFLHLRGLPRGFFNTAAGLLIITLITLYAQWGKASGEREEQGAPAKTSPNWIERLRGGAEGVACTTAPVTIVQTVTVTVDSPEATGKSKFPAGVFTAHDEDYASLLTDSDLPALATLRIYAFFGGLQRS